MTIQTENKPAFTPYSPLDKEGCLDLFDKNCPEFFAPNEREDYLLFLDSNPPGYEVCRVGGDMAGGLGLKVKNSNQGYLNWILIAPRFQGMGIGSAMMRRIMAQGKALSLDIIKIPTSHKAAPFFAGFGAIRVSETKDGWGPGMHRVEMELRL